MGSFGERLQREREMRGITLEEIAEATKIGTRSLRALEQQDFDKLPGGIFNKGFVRAYSRYLGLDEEQAVADYLTAVGEAQAAAKSGKSEAGPDGELTDKNIRIVEAEGPQPIQVPWRPLLGLVAILALAAGGWWYVASYGIPKTWHVRAAGHSAKPAHKQAEAVPAQPVSPPAATSQTTGPTTPGEDAARSAASALPPGPDKASSPANATQPSSDGFVLTIKAKEQAWISVTTDGKTEPSELMGAGEQKMVRAQRRVVLRTGNAAAIELYQNDKLLPSLGGAGQVRKVAITTAGLQNAE